VQLLRHDLAEFRVKCIAQECTITARNTSFAVLFVQQVLSTLADGRRLTEAPVRVAEDDLETLLVLETTVTAITQQPRPLPIWVLGDYSQPRYVHDTEYPCLMFIYLCYYKRTGCFVCSACGV